MTRALRHPLLWAVPLLSALLAAIITYAYIGGFTDPIDNLEGLPVGIVNLDEPTEAAGTPLAVGATFEKTLFAKVEAATQSPVELRSYPTVAEAKRALDDNQVAGVAILPKELSANVAAIGATLGAAEPVRVEVLVNAGSGALPPTVVTQAATQAAEELSKTVSTMLASRLSSLGLKIEPTNVGSLADPIELVLTDHPVLTNLAGRGLPPLYYSVVLTLVGLLTAAAVHALLGAMGGHEELTVLGRPLHLPRLELSVLERYLTEAIVVLPAAVTGGLVATLVARGWLGTQVDQPAALALYSVAAVAVMGWVILALLTGFGLAGTLVGVLVTTIFGVPSARGVYPAEAMPGFFRHLGFLPMRWFADGARSIFYFDGRGAAGLRGALVALVVYAALALAAGFGLARLSQRRADAPR